MKMLWGGRFEKAPKKILLEYNSAENVLLDDRLVPYDIQGSVAHATMLGEQGIITREEKNKIVKGLRKLLARWKAGKFVLKKELEDVHMNVERALEEEIGEVAGKLHTARSRNDQVNVDTRLYMRGEIDALSSEVLALAAELLSIAKKHVKTVMPGYTHTRAAQPITLAFWCSAYAEMFLRDAERLNGLRAHVNKSPLGACALAGTSWPIDRARTAKLLGFEEVQENALDIVSSRGELEAELIMNLSLAMTHCSRLANELILYSSEQFGFFEPSDEFTTGSSIMPQKKNPDALEIMRARAARVQGNLCAILSLQKDLISGHNADTQETKVLLFESIDIAKGSLAIMREVLKSMSVNKKAMSEACEKGHITATDLADLLARKGVPFRKAHHIVGAIVKECIKKGAPLNSLTLEEVQKRAGVKVSAEELIIATDVIGSVSSHRSGAAPSNVKRILEMQEKRVKKLKKAKPGS